MRIAIMQPYFLPYAGYFRLMLGVDAFVVYDTAQFPRRRWVSRNRLRMDEGRPEWLTLPLAYAPLRTAIMEMRFAQDAQGAWSSRVARFAVFRKPAGDAIPVVRRAATLSGSLADYLCATLESVRDQLGLRTPLVRASSLAVSQAGDRCERLVAICRELGATEYVNAPGGRRLYTAEQFAMHGIALRFLPEYRGDHASVLQRLQDESAVSIRSEIVANLGD